MDKKAKILLFVILSVVVLLAVLVFFASYKIASIETQYKSLAEGVKNIKVIDGVNGNDGKNGLNGSNGLNGRDGNDSLSTHLIEKIYVQPPAEIGKTGEKGADGKDAPIQEIQINPDTKDLETKSTNDRFWKTLIPCAELLKSCPGEIVTKVEQK